MSGYEKLDEFLGWLREVMFGIVDEIIIEWVNCIVDVYM
jgi:hypothetical protein